MDECFGGADLQLEVRLHAAAAVEQHDAGDRLDVVRENGQLLLDAVVVDFEVVAREVGREVPLRVSDRRVDCDRARRGAERRRLLLRVRDGERGRGTQPVVKSRPGIENSTKAGTLILPLS